MKVIVDTNVLVSGIFFGGFPGRIIAAWGKGELEFVVSPAILDEYVRVSEDLARRKGIDVEKLIRLLALRSVICSPPRFHDQVCADQDDDKFLECAVHSQVRHIITGDKALLDVTCFKDIQILKPADFVRKYL